MKVSLKSQPDGAIMNVLHLYRTYFPDSQGGLEEVIRQICIGTRKKGVTSRVFTLSDEPFPKYLPRPEGDVVRVRKTFEIASCGVALSGLRSFARQVEWADVVHYHYPWPFSDVLYGFIGRRKPAVLTYHSDVVRQKLLLSVYRPVMSRYLDAMDLVVATSPNYFATSGVLRRLADKVEVIPIGLDEPSYPNTETHKALLQDTQEQYGQGFFLFVGVLRYYKGLHILLEAIQGASYNVVIAGSGPVESELRKQAKTLGLTNVIFAGFVSDREKMFLFQLCSAVVFPSYLRAEAFGVTLLEGAMSSRPLISAEVGSGTSHVNIHNDTGLVVPPGDSTALRAAMDELHCNPEKSREMGANARKRYEQLFTGALMGERYASAYQKVLGAGGGGAAAG
jgi:O-antigen biosynthesis rhamnosyltransferase